MTAPPMPMVRTVIQLAPEFEAWRSAARQALIAGVIPEAVDFRDNTIAAADSIFFAMADLAVSAHRPQRDFTPHVPKSFLTKAEVVARNCDPERWNLLYRLLWRLQTERSLMRIETDTDVHRFLRLEQQVRRDLHKMHAFVRFRRIEDERGEHFIAWYRPEHRILRMAVPFFEERFAVMRWSILTAEESVAWEPETKQLRYGPGVGKDRAPEADDQEELWKTYYRSIFNPARTNAGAMRGHMPVKYWEQLPEVATLPLLLQNVERRVSAMVQVQSAKPTASPYIPEKHTVVAIHEALPRCKGCELYQCATQVVRGTGAGGAALMLVGEQPGDEEDLQGQPFVGPAGEVLRRALTELSIAVSDLYVTNAVKHFKFVRSGKRRLHQSPRLSEIMACRPWLLAEIDAVQPKVVLCLGASAAKSILGGTFALMRDRGKLRSTPFAENVMATVHPSAVLRARDQTTRDLLYRHLRDDLEAAHLFARNAVS